METACSPFELFESSRPFPFQLLVKCHKYAPILLFIVYGIFLLTFAIDKYALTNWYKSRAAERDKLRAAQDSNACNNEASTAKISFGKWDIRNVEPYYFGILVAMVIFTIDVTMWLRYFNDWITNYDAVTLETVEKNFISKFLIKALNALSVSTIVHSCLMVVILFGKFADIHPSSCIAMCKPKLRAPYDEKTAWIVFSVAMSCTQKIFHYTIGCVFNLITKILKFIATFGIDLRIIWFPGTILELLQRKWTLESMRVNHYTVKYDLDFGDAYLRDTCELFLNSLTLTIWSRLCAGSQYKKWLDKHIAFVGPVPAGWSNKFLYHTASPDCGDKSQACMYTCVPCCGACIAERFLYRATLLKVRLGGGKLDFEPSFGVSDWIQIKLLSCCGYCKGRFHKGLDRHVRFVGMDEKLVQKIELQHVGQAKETKLANYAGYNQAYTMDKVYDASNAAYGLPMQGVGSPSPQDPATGQPYGFPVQSPMMSPNGTNQCYNVLNNQAFHPGASNPNGAMPHSFAPMITQAPHMLNNVGDLGMPKDASATMPSNQGTHVRNMYSPNPYQTTSAPMQSNMPNQMFSGYAIPQTMGQNGLSAYPTQPVYRQMPNQTISEQMQMPSGNAIWQTIGQSSSSAYPAQQVYPQVPNQTTLGPMQMNIPNQGYPGCNVSSNIRQPTVQNVLASNATQPMQLQASQGPHMMQSMQPQSNIMQQVRPQVQSFIPHPVTSQSPQPSVASVDASQFTQPQAVPPNGVQFDTPTNTITITGQSSPQVNEVSCMPMTTVPSTGRAPTSVAQPGDAPVTQQVNPPPLNQQANPPDPNSETNAMNTEKET